jgi:C1A family cysteine protease
LETYLAQTTHGGHAVTLVGYTPDCFIVRNSWSTDWGDCGFAYASLSYVEAAFTEAYGVSVL